ncbi:MAG: hypothetical protein Q4B06_00185 [Candidatus Saccharibacteria bacterium]|nr:hypothetical protein [Candidatus Saccharibacteria bacterium]
MSNCKMSIDRKTFLAVVLGLAGLYVSAWLYGAVQSPQHDMAMRVVVYGGYIALLAGIGWVLYTVMRDVKVDTCVQLWASISAAVMAGLWMLAGSGGVVYTLVSAVALLFVMRTVFVATLQCKKGALWLKLAGIAMVIVALAFIVSIEKLRTDEHCLQTGQSTAR